MKGKEFPGTSIDLSDLKAGKLCFTADKPKAQYAWDCGVAMGRYLQELKKGKLIGIKCNKCERIMVPPRAFCEVCFRPCDEWVYLKDTGTVNTFSLSYITWDVKQVKKPFIPSVIEIDGASPGMGILHLLDEVDPKKVKIGMKVKAVWLPEKERTGSVTDIKYFKPI